VCDLDPILGNPGQFHGLGGLGRCSVWAGKLSHAIRATALCPWAFIEHTGGTVRMRFADSRFFVTAALGIALTLGMTAVALSYTPTPAQGRAENACRERGLQPNSAAWELCLSHVTRAYEWGEISLAQQLARASGDAAESCLSSGHPQSAAYRSCISREIDARSHLMVLGDDQSGRNLAYGSGSGRSAQQ
jgi:hypothetical protein